MLEEICLHCIVSGKVQGVWFRATTREEALKLGLRGWVRNLPEGQVEVLICGSKEKVAELLCWLRAGPPLAKVLSVTSEELPLEEHADFKVI